VDGPTSPIKDPWGMQRSAVSATTKINRKDFGVNWAKTMDTGGAIVGDEVNITLDIEMVQPPAGK
jgi:polyisoprenoid-binding protein YceI